MQTSAPHLTVRIRRLMAVFALGATLCCLPSIPLPTAYANTLFDVTYPEGEHVRLEAGPPASFDAASAPWKEVPKVPGIRYAMYQEFMILAFLGDTSDRVQVGTLTEPDRLVFDWPGVSFSLDKPQAVEFGNNDLLTELRSSVTDGNLRVVLETASALPIQELAPSPDGWRLFWIGTRFELRLQKTVTPEVLYLKRVMVDASGQRRVHTVRANLKKSGFEPAIAFAADANHKRASVPTLMKALGGYVAINGGYFDGAGRSQGLLVRDGIMKNKPIMERPSLAMNAEGQLAIGFLPVIGKISGLRAEVSFERINGHFDGNYIQLLAPGHPARLAEGPQVANAWKVVIANDIVTRVGFEPLTQAERQTCHVLLVPPALAFEANFQPGEQIRAEYQVGRAGPGSIYTALQAGPMLVRDGRAMVSTQGDFPGDIRRGRAPRSAVGLTREGDLILMAVDGRSSTAAGATLSELANYLVEAGCWTAMNLDGGSSTQLVVAGELVTQNPAGAKPVANALVLVDRQGRFGRQELYF